LKEAEIKFRETAKYKPELQDEVNDKLNDICEIYIEDGDNYLEERKIDEAINSYREPLRIFDEYPLAKVKIGHAKEVEKNIKKAEKLVDAGNKLFNEKEYEKSVLKYQQAYTFDKISSIYEQNS